MKTNRRAWTTVILAAWALAAAAIAAPVGAQQDRATVVAQERALVAQENARREQVEAQEQALRERQRELETRNRELERAQRQMEQARRQLEAAAQQVAQLSLRDGMPNFESIQVLRDFDPTGQRAYLGLNIENAGDGARVVGVTPGGAAANAGIRVGDVIMAIDGTVLADDDGPPAAVLVDALQDHEPGDDVTVLVSRNDGQEELSLDVRLDDAPPGGHFRVMQRRGPGGPVEVLRPGAIYRNGFGDFTAMPGLFSPRWRGMELVTLTEGLAEYFGTDEGLLVVRAPANEDVGLRDGDVILEIGGRIPSSPEHAMRILTSFAPGETLELSIMRGQRRQSIEYEIPDAERN